LFHRNTSGNNYIRHRYIMRQESKKISKKTLKKHFQNDSKNGEKKSR